MESDKIELNGNDAIGSGGIEVSCHAGTPVPFTIKFEREGTKPKIFAFDRYNAKQIVRFIVENL